jgi:hypothetical protein
MRYRFLLLPVLVVGLASSASAGIIFNKKPKVVPEKRVPELLTTARTDGDENKRYDAVAELRDYDPKLFPQIVPTLIEVLMNDKKASVRSEAAQTLSKLRPVSREVAEALEHARDKDASLRVRMQARNSLLSYHWAGWWSDPGKLKPDGPTPPTTKEPPLAPPVQTQPQPLPPVTPVTTLKPRPEPAPGPLPAPVIATPPPPPSRTTPGAVQPLPKGPPVEEKGPELGPPN